MGTKTVEFTPNESQVDQIDAEADELHLSRSAYVQMMFEAGRLLFQSSGKLDTNMLADLVDGNQNSFQSGENLAEIEDDITATILDKLPADPDRPASKEEVREMVFGTKEEQMEMTEKALKALYDEGEIESAFDGGYYNDK